MGTKNNPSPFDCYAAADPDEPLFVLLARDKFAPAMVWLWAALREFDGEDAAKIKEAQQCVVDMMKWQAEHGLRSVGLGQAVLAGIMEMIRVANQAARSLDGKSPDNQETGVDVFRRFLAATTFEPKGD